ncbi:MAG: hypothetical protein ACRDA3_05300 [Peptostreptococcaceae bacterium]
MKDKINIKNIYNLCTNEYDTSFNSIIGVGAILFINVVPLFFNKIELLNFNADALLYINSCVLFMGLLFSELYIHYYKRGSLVAYLPVTKLEYILSLYTNGIICTLQLCLGLSISVILGMNPFSDVYALFTIGIVITSISILLSRINLWLSMIGTTIFFVGVIYNTFSIKFINFKIILRDIKYLPIIIIFMMISLLVSYKIYSKKDMI